jgi:hypothetical protein
MDALTLNGEDILIITDEPAPRRGAAGRWRVARRVGVASLAGLTALVVTVGVVRGVRESRREKCAAHLKRLGLAMHEYHGERGYFPSPAISRGRGWPRCWSGRGRRSEMRRGTSDHSIVGKLTANLGAADDAAIVSNTAAGGITVNGNPLALQQVP